MVRALAVGPAGALGAACAAEVPVSPAVSIDTRTATAMVEAAVGRRRMAMNGAGGACEDGMARPSEGASPSTSNPAPVAMRRSARAYRVSRAPRACAATTSPAAIRTTSLMTY